MAVLSGQLSIFLRQPVTIQKSGFPNSHSLREKKKKRYKGEKCVKILNAHHEEDSMSL